MLTFAAWRGGRNLGLAELISSLGSLVEGYEWQLDIEWIIPEIPIPQHAWLTTDHLLELFESQPQLVDGEVMGRMVGASTPDLCVRALDGGWWDIRTSKVDVLRRIRELYPDAAQLEEW